MEDKLIPIVFATILGIALVIDSYFKKGFFSQDLVIRYLGRKFERIFERLAGILMLGMAIYLFVLK